MSSSFNWQVYLVLRVRSSTVLYYEHNFKAYKWFIYDYPLRDVCVLGDKRNNVTELPKNLATSIFCDHLLGKMKKVLSYKNPFF